jgi:hypothetical protein
MKKFNREDLITLIVAFIVFIPYAAIFWFIYKIILGIFFLLNKLIDKI